jgi:hypothetical protein
MEVGIKNKLSQASDDCESIIVKKILMKLSCHVSINKTYSSTNRPEKLIQIMTYMVVVSSQTPAF